MRGGMKKVNQNIFLFVDHVARNSYEMISLPKLTHLMFDRNVSTNFFCLQWGFFES